MTSHRAAHPRPQPRPPLADPGLGAQFWRLLRRQRHPDWRQRQHRDRHAGGARGREDQLQHVVGGWVPQGRAGRVCTCAWQLLAEAPAALLSHHAIHNTLAAGSIRACRSPSCRWPWPTCGCCCASASDPARPCSDQSEPPEAPQRLPHLLRTAHESCTSCCNIIITPPAMRPALFLPNW